MNTEALQHKAMGFQVRANQHAGAGSRADSGTMATTRGHTVIFSAPCE